MIQADRAAGAIAAAACTQDQQVGHSTADGLHGAATAADALEQQRRGATAGSAELDRIGEGHRSGVTVAG